MRVARYTIAAVVTTILSLALISTAAGAPKRLDLDGQAITGHEVLNGQGGKIRKVVFSTAVSVPGGEFRAFMSEEILQEKHSIVSIYWHGDDASGKIRSSRIANSQARGVMQKGGPRVAVVRPHGFSKYNWRQVSEIRLQIALVEYLSRTFGVKKFNLFGHSGGGLVAIAVAQERPELVATVGLASPKLAVRIHYSRYEGGVPSRYYRQYDPINHIRKLSPEVPVLIVYDLRDNVVKKAGVLPYTKKAEKLGLKVRLVLVTINAHPYHDTQWLLGRELWKPENSDFRPREE